MTGTRAETFGKYRPGEQDDAGKAEQEAAKTGAYLPGRGQTGRDIRILGAASCISLPVITSMWCR